MGHEPQSRNDLLTVVAAVTGALFLLMAANGMKTTKGDIPTIVATRTETSSGVSQANDQPPIQSQLWNRDNQKSDTMQSPPAALRLPPTLGSRPVWHKSSGGVESWGFVTTRDAQEVGVAVLDHYEKLDGWELARAETLGLWASSWWCTVYRIESKEVVMVTALPERLGEVPGGERNTTRVSVARVAGEEALRDVLGMASEPGR